MNKTTGDSLNALMEEIQKVRYTDLDQERRLCQKLLVLADERGDRYAAAFGNIYLGDYYVAKNDSRGCAPCLLKGLSISCEEDYKELQIKAYCLLGIYFEMLGDEHSAMEYHMNGLRLAKLCGNKNAQCICYTNISNDFQQYGDYQNARHYCQEAFYLMEHMEELGEMDEETLFLKIVVISNLVEQSIATGDLEDARQYCMDCETLAVPHEKAYWGIYVCRNWILYYAASDHVDRAIFYVERLLKEEEYIRENGMIGFDLCRLICTRMIELGNREYAFLFYQMICDTGEENGEIFKLHILDMNMKLLLRFGSRQDIEQAYENYYEKQGKIEKLCNNIRVDAMRSKITLCQVMKEQADMKMKKQSLETAAHIDELTQLYNRRYFNTLKSQCFSNPRIKRIGIVMLDIDSFKEYNDYYGHPKGDLVLVSVASCMVKHGTEHIIISRFGGDEFICLCVDLQDEEIVSFIKKVQEELYGMEIHHAMSTCSDRVSLSIGFANESMEKKIQAYELFEMADRALYRSKLKGKNTFSQERYG